MFYQICFHSWCFTSWHNTDRFMQHMPMNENSNTQTRTFVKDATLCNELRLLIVDKIKTFGYCKETCKLKRGAFTAVVHDLHLSKMTVLKIWNLNAVLDSIVPCKAKPGPQRKLSNEDTLYIKQLVLLKPTFY